MSIAASLAIIILAALIHSSFQLSLSVLTILSGHTIGSKNTQKKLFSLTTNFLFGAGIITLLLMSVIVLILINLFGSNSPQVIWAGGCGLLFGVAISVWLFYYRRQKGTALWIPRGVAKYLMVRTKATKMKSEAFGLGMMSVMGEILFIIAPLFVGSLAITQLPAPWQILGIIVYAEISLSSLSIIWFLIGRGKSLSKIQRWRENNKYFLQFVAGAGLIVLSLFVYVYEILGTTVGGL
ncbi:MAG: hypothetical protein WCQ49_03340 [Candidatus Saccharibacteria bacterium]